MMGKDIDVNMLATLGRSFFVGGGIAGALTLLVDSEKLQNFASTSRLVNFSL